MLTDRHDWGAGDAIAKVMSRACRKADVGDAVRDEQSEAPGIGRAADTLFEEEPVENQLAARRAARV